MRRKNAAVLMTAVIIGGLLTSCGSAYNNANGKNSDNTVETQTTVRTVVNGETKTDGNNVKTADKETGDFTQEVTSEENNLTDNDIASNTEASEQQAFDDLSAIEKARMLQFQPDNNLYNIQLYSAVCKVCGVDTSDEGKIFEDYQAIYEKTLEMQPEWSVERKDGGRERAR